jgi:hypothetical protein
VTIKHDLPVDPDHKMVCILSNAASVSEHAGLSPGNMQQTLSMAQGCKSRVARRGAGSNQASSTSQAGAQTQQEASPSPFGHRLKYATVTLWLAI